MLAGRAVRMRWKHFSAVSSHSMVPPRASLMGQYQVAFSKHLNFLCIFLDTQTIRQWKKRRRTTKKRKERRAWKEENHIYKILAKIIPSHERIFYKKKKKTCLLTSLKKLHWVNDGMVSVYTEGHQDIGRGIQHNNLRIGTRGHMWLHMGQDMHAHSVLAI